MTAPDFKLIRELPEMLQDIANSTNHRDYSEACLRVCSNALQFAAELRKVVALCEVQRRVLEEILTGEFDYEEMSAKARKALAASAEPESN